MNISKKINYPKILIIGQNFSGKTGAAITLRQLFKNWPLKNIAVASFQFDEFDSDAYLFCKNVYKLGDEEIKILPLYKKFFKIHKSQIFDAIPDKPESSIHTKHKKSSIFRILFKQFLIITGLNSIRLKYTLSKQFIAWYKDFNPQIIYTALGDLDLIRFVNKVNIINNTPIAIHIWDDWPNTLANRTILKKYWKKKIDFEFRRLIEKSNLLLSISNAMSEKYKVLYDKSFIAFHNPIEISQWDQIPEWETDSKKHTILYVGKINKETKSLLLMMADVVEKIIRNRPELDIEFLIYTPDFEISSKRFSKYKHTCVKKAIPHTEIIEKMKRASVLYLPLGFSKKSINYTKLSMPTKTSEYMMSGVPVLVIAPLQIALTKYAKEEEWASVVTSPNKNVLKAKLLELLTKNEVRKKLIKKSLSLVKKNHNAENVRSRFVALLSENAKYE